MDIESIAPLDEPSLLHAARLKIGLSDFGDDRAGADQSNATRSGVISPAIPRASRRRRAARPLPYARSIS